MKAALLVLALPALGAISGRWLDLTRPVEPGATVKAKPSLFFVHPETFETRLEAPAVFEKKGATVDQLALDALAGPAVVIDAIPWCSSRPDCQVRREDLQDFERLRGKIPEGAVVFIKTGDAKYWGDRARYLMQDADPKDKRAHHPGLHPNAAQWLAEERRPKLVVIDAPSIDYGPSKLLETHRALFAKNIPVIENAGDLSSIPQTGAYAVALPEKVKGAAFAPARLAAVVDPVR